MLPNSPVHARPLLVHGVGDRSRCGLQFERGDIASTNPTSGGFPIAFKQRFAPSSTDLVPLFVEGIHFVETESLGVILLAPFVSPTTASRCASSVTTDLASAPAAASAAGHRWSLPSTLAWPDAGQRLPVL